MEYQSGLEEIATIYNSETDLKKKASLKQKRESTDNATSS